MTFAQADWGLTHRILGLVDPRAAPDPAGDALLPTGGR